MLPRVILAVILFCVSYEGLAKSDAHVDADVVSVSNASLGHNATVTVRSAEIESRDIYADAEEGNYPRRFRVVGSVNITVDGRSIFVPRSVFSDLAWVGSVRLRSEKSKFLLIFLCGDASESFEVAVVFDRDRVRTRYLYDSGASGRLLERTTYYEDVGSN